MFSDDLILAATDVLNAARAKAIRIATAESCTGGLIAGLLTEVAGASDVVERGFVTYSNQAKQDMLGVPAALLAAHGAVSEQVAAAMAQGALAHARADLAVAVTGIAGPGGGSADKPVGLVFIAARRAGRPATVQRHLFTGMDRHQVRKAALAAALALLHDKIKEQAG